MKQKADKTKQPKLIEKHKRTVGSAETNKEAKVPSPLARTAGIGEPSTH